MTATEWGTAWMIVTAAYPDAADEWVASQVEACLADETFYARMTERVERLAEEAVGRLHARL